MRTLTWAATALLTFGTAFAAEQTMVGRISDSMCGASHKSAMEHGGKKMTDRDCTLGCVKGGGKYVFINKGKQYQIANQDYAGLQEHAGHTVRLKGEVSGDSITVSDITMPGKGHMKKKAS